MNVTADARQDPAMLPTLFWDFSTLGINQPFISLEKPEYRSFISKNKLSNGSRFSIADNFDTMLVTLKTEPDLSPRAVLHWLTMKPVVIEVNSHDRSL